MATQFSGHAIAQFDWVFTNVGDISSPVDNYALKISKALADGDGEDECNQMYLARRILTPATGTDLLDLSGSLVNQFGQTITFSQIKGILIHNLGDPLGTDPETWTVMDGMDLLIGGASSNAWAAIFNGVAASKLVLPPDGVLLLTAPSVGYTVTAGSGDVLQIAWDGLPSGDDIEYDIVLFGVQ